MHKSRVTLIGSLAAVALAVGAIAARGDSGPPPSYPTPTPAPSATICVGAPAAVGVLPHDPGVPGVPMNIGPGADSCTSAQQANTVTNGEATR
jgi:hypothetical protein